MMILSEKWKWPATLIVLVMLGWVMLHSPWAEWAPPGTKWPSLLVAFLFGMTSFLTLSYYPILVVTVLVSIAFAFSPSRHSNLKIHFLPKWTVFLLGFTVIFTLQSMGTIPVSAHGSSGNFFLETSAGGLFILAALVSIVISQRSNPGTFLIRWSTRIPLTLLIFFLGMGWGVYFGHDFDPAYDRKFFQVGAGPGSHELPALILFGIGLIGLQAFWNWGAKLLLKDHSVWRIARSAAGFTLGVLGVLMSTGSHPF
jgi:hypothetical protein